MRYERKYKINHLPVSLVNQAVRLHPAGFRKIYPDRQINNVYFDTLDMRTFHDNVAGTAERRKFRVRWYGLEPKTIIQPKMEIKYRVNAVGGKTVLDAMDFQLHNLQDLTKQVNELSETNAILRPTLMNSYYRSYYGTSDGLYRITIDSDLRYSSLLNTPFFTRYMTREDVVVMELKYEEEFDNLTDRISQHFPFRQTKSSKYVTGVLLTS